MIVSQFFRNREKRRRFAHIGAGVVILIPTYEKQEAGHGSYLPFAIAGLVFLCIAVLHPIIGKKIPWVDGLFFTIEGILSIIVAFDNFHLGKKGTTICLPAPCRFSVYYGIQKKQKRN